MEKLEQLTLRVQPKERCVIVVNGTKLKANGEWCYVWASVDVDTRELLAVRVCWARDILDARLFLEDAFKACTNRPHFFVDGDPGTQRPSGS